MPYVAGLTVRAPHFLAGHRDDYPLLQLQMSRWIEMTRAVAPLMAADWYLLEALADCRFVINDRGFAWASDQPNSRVGLLVPITARYALVVFPCAERLIAGLNPAGVWLTALPQMAMTAEGVAGANAAIARDAVSWYAGAEPEDIAGLTFGEPDLDCSRLDTPGRIGGGWGRTIKIGQRRCATPVSHWGRVIGNRSESCPRSSRASAHCRRRRVLLSISASCSRRTRPARNRNLKGPDRNRPS